MEQDSFKELQEVLGKGFKDFFPKGIVGIIEKETYQSETFFAAGYHTMPDRYGPGDRYFGTD